MVSMSAKTIIFPAKKIITMFPEQPVATAVAVRDGRILAVGQFDDIRGWVKNSPYSPYEVDTIFENKILMPGLVDAHTHVELQALMYSGHFVSQIPWPRPGGGFFPVYPTKADVLNRLKELDRQLPPGEVLYAVAYDEYKTGAFLHIDELDDVSTDRPILVSNLVWHRHWANSFLLQKTGVDLNNPPAGVETDSNGKPNGTLIEARGLLLVLPAVPDLLDISAAKIERILPLFTAGGHTTVTEAAFGALGFEKALATFQGLFSNPEVNVRVMGFPWAGEGIGQAGSVDSFIEVVKKAAEQDFDKLRIGPVKLYTDGSIISRTSPIGWPGYWDGTVEGHMQGDTEQITDQIIHFHDAGLSTVTHANSRPGCQVVLDAVKEAQCRHYRPDMRHRMDHAYNITEYQLRLARELGMTVQFFTTQIYYYGDAHLKLQGPDRAHQITPTGTAKRLGVSWGFHNDPPGTPQLPWVAAWATVHRMTGESGTILGPNQRVPVEDVLRAMTIEAAYQLHLDREIGSIAFGKKADFCVLDADPLEIDPMELKDIPVWGTVFGGQPNPATS
jgi:predicted amidohydrolase YtcJ